MWRNKTEQAAGNLIRTPAQKNKGIIASSQNQGENTPWPLDHSDIALPYSYNSETLIF